MTEPTTPFPLIVIEGDAFTRGVSYGAQAKERIARSLAFYADAVVPSMGATFGQIIDGVSQRLSIWRSRDPEIVSEIEGIAQGSGFSVGEILALNTRGMFVVPPAIQREAKAANDGCTSFAVMPEASRDGHLLTGQNWDYLEEIADTIVLVHLRPTEGPRQLMIAEAGQVGRHGANSAGIALHANGLSSRLRDPSALPSTFMRRRILRSGNITEAVEMATAGTRPGSTNLLITHRDGFAVDIETMPATTRWMYPTDGWLFHTNHYLVEIPPELARDLRAECRLDRPLWTRVMADGARPGVGRHRSIGSRGDPSRSPRRRSRPVQPPGSRRATARALDDGGDGHHGSHRGCHVGGRRSAVRARVRRDRHRIRPGAGPAGRSGHGLAGGGQPMMTDDRPASPAQSTQEERTHARD